MRQHAHLYPRKARVQCTLMPGQVVVTKGKLGSHRDGRRQGPSEQSAPPQAEKYVQNHTPTLACRASRM